MAADRPAEAPKRSLAQRLYHGETSFDFVGRRRRWFVLSGIVVLIGALSLLTQSHNYGIDFNCGTTWELAAPGVSVGDARDAMEDVGLADAKIQVLGSDTLRIQAGIQSAEAQQRITAAVAELGDVDVTQVSVNDVGPSWGEAVTNKARTALIVFFVLIAIYISLRFEWKMAVAALAAVVHDILVTVGVYSLSRFEVTPATVVAFLTILGYSLYDTIVVFDKVQENTRGLSAQRRMTYSDTVNLSMNQVLMRSLNTSLVAILPILSVLVVGSGLLGAATLKDFGLALLVGLLTGAYSSIFIASPILAMLKERESQYQAIRQRVGGRSQVLTPAAAAAMAGGGAGAAKPGGRREARGEPSEPEQETPVATATGGKEAKARASGPATRPRPASTARPGAPRPRKKGKRR